VRFGLGDLELDEERFELRSRGVKVPVEPKVLRILLLLVKNRQRVVSKQELLEAEWAGVRVSEASLWRAIMLARRALADDLQQILVTVRGRGFRIAAPVEERAGATPGTVEAAIDPTFVGRAACLTALEGRLDEALAFRGNVVWLTGEAGIGKTRVADELARRARARGANVVFGRVHDVTPAPPFMLWAQVARGLALERSGPPAAAFLERMKPVLHGETVAGSERIALFDHLARFVLEASRAVPLVLALDDLHRADEDSLDLLRYLVREIRGGALLVVGAFRDTAIAGDARARALGELLRECASDVVPLRAFTEADVAEYVEVTAGMPPPKGMALELLKRSGGNPLYLNQLLKTDWADRALNERATSLATSMDLEQGVIEAVSVHLEEIGPDTRHLLTTAAVLGREIETAKLAAVSEQPFAALLDRLDDALRARLLVKEGAVYRFSHVLVRDVLYKRLGGAERAQMHRHVAEKLSAHYGENVTLHAAELARHLVRALPDADATRAIDLALAAAGQEMARGAYARALKCYGLASQALAHVHGERARRIELQLGVARAQARLGDQVAAREAFLDAAMLARAFGAPEALAQAAFGFCALPIAKEDALREGLRDEGLSAIEGVAGDAAARLRADLTAAVPSTGRPSSPRARP
jgi:DNA-binding winged helix-turn-helix (wHTH) protein